ncbi:MAG: phage terminase large subunit family protein, partial [Pseudorhodoplanes sp.]|nr:phage terminase large subunit family protein [Pseudorhodoplanes sp.]
AAKDALFARLRLTEPGPGMLHFPMERDAEFFRQLTAERVVTRLERGRPIRLWQPRREGEHNEALDTTVYAMAALHGLISMGLRLNEEADAIGAVPGKGAPAPARPAEAPRVIRSRWMG